MTVIVLAHASPSAFVGFGLLLSQGGRIVVLLVQVCEYELTGKIQIVVIITKTPNRKVPIIFR